MKPIYLDYNATTPVAPEVVKEMKPYLEEHFGNPSSSHYYGRIAKQALEKARMRVASLLNTEPKEIVFTSGGTESNNYAILGAAFENSESEQGHIITSQIEHPAVINVCKKLEEFGFEVTYIPVDKWGKLDVAALENSIRNDTVLISIMFANNEIGTIQPIGKIAKIAKGHDIIFHTDAAQAVGKIPTDVKKMGVDLLSVAGHKFYAPKGVGVLYIRDGVELEKFMYGAGQENGRRPGTENIPEIVGIGKAAQLAEKKLSKYRQHMREMRDLLYELISASQLDFRRNGHLKDNLPNTLSLSFADVNSIDIIEKLDKVAISAGAACHSDKNKISDVLKAIDLPKKYTRGTLRFSVGRFTTKEDITRAAKQIIKVIPQLQKN